jgi:hypothetical protein
MLLSCCELRARSGLPFRQKPRAAATAILQIERRAAEPLPKSLYHARTICGAEDVVLMSSLIHSPIRTPAFTSEPWTSEPEGGLRTRKIQFCGAGRDFQSGPSNAWPMSGLRYGELLRSGGSRALATGTLGEIPIAHDARREYSLPEADWPRWLLAVGVKQRSKAQRTV